MSSPKRISIRTPDDVPDGTPMAVSLYSTRSLTTGTWRTFRPVYVTRPSPCNLDCPAGTDVRGFLTRAAEGDAAGAWRLILEKNPLPGICGRVCYHPCEGNCNRGGLDERVSVHAIERAIADEAARLQVADVIRTDVAAPTGRSVGVIGSGPAGLSCAYQLARLGHAVTVFDDMPEPGGMLRYGIPAYRLPRHVLDTEINLLRRIGVTLTPNAKLGASLPWSQLDTFDAVFVAVGTHKSRPASVAGEDLAGVKPALDFLRRVNRGEKLTVAPTVVVLGGGNTAMDAARVARRHGADVTIAYRRTREDMPAHPDEIAQAEAEGVKFIFNVMPVAFRGNGAVAQVELQRTRPGAPDASGRRRPEPIPGDVFNLATGEVLMALGEELEREAFEGILDLARGRLQADRWGRTGKKQLFAGGDAATGAGTVVEAIGSGRRAAEAIDAWLGGRELPEQAQAEAVQASDLNVFYFGLVRRAQPPVLDVRRRTEFDEVVGGLGWRGAMAEARRCLSCGLCTSCNNCVLFCPDSAASRTTTGYTIDLTHCKGCGLCVSECPRGAMELVPEESR